MRCLLSRTLPALLAGIVALGLVLAAPDPGAAAPLSGARAGAATESRLASETALAVLKRGGDAVDAAVAAALAAGVVAPTSSGLGGGGFALIYRASDKSVVALDFREAAPAVLDTGAFERRPLPDDERGKLVGVPTEVRGLAELHRRFGRRPWAELVAPAERFARDGFAVEAHLASTLAGKDAKRYRRVASLDRSFWPGGAPAIVGQRVKRPELGRTLRTLAAAGPEALYTGAIAEDIVGAVTALGGTLTRDDLTRSRARERPPLRFRWEGYEIVTMPPPSAGGVFLAEVLSSFTRAELEQAGFRTPGGMHLVAEIMRGALADRARYLGDPDVLPVDIARLLEPKRLLARKGKVAPDRTQTLRGLANEDHGTHAMIVADAAGNVVSLTTTVNTAFGAEIGGETSGIVLNDELDDFTSRLASTAIGITHPPNAARPGRRPTSSMMPTIVLSEGKPVLALAGSGGYSIPPSVTETLLGILVHGETPEVAVKAPRFRFDSKDFATLLDAAYGEATREELVRRGETVRMSESSSAVQVLSFTPTGIVGAADPRKGGAVRLQ
jgi:gamma-glutamyltranspeptidase / glutathione hydrolase